VRPGRQEQEQEKAGDARKKDRSPCLRSIKPVSAVATSEGTVLIAVYKPFSTAGHKASSRSQGRAGMMMALPGSDANPFVRPRKDISCPYSKHRLGW